MIFGDEKDPGTIEFDNPTPDVQYHVNKQMSLELFKFIIKSEIVLLIPNFSVILLSTYEICTIKINLNYQLIVGNVCLLYFIFVVFYLT